VLGPGDCCAGRFAAHRRTDARGESHSAGRSSADRRECACLLSD
jgi:hypothetical protein